MIRESRQGATVANFVRIRPFHNLPLHRGANGVWRAAVSTSRSGFRSKCAIVRIASQRLMEDTMDVKSAIATAKEWVLDVLKDENITNVGLEEVEHDDQNG